jgi:hypothetical protein
LKEVLFDAFNVGKNLCECIECNLRTREPYLSKRRVERAPAREMHAFD